MFLTELGFSYVIEKIIEASQKNPNFCFVGHNPSYDLLYVYNQFVGPLPDSYKGDKGFAQEWNSRFP